MNAAITRMGILYGKLGLSTSTSLIEARAKSIEAASEEFGAAHLSDVLGCAFGLNRADIAMPLADQLSAEDPTFDVRQNQAEAALLATTLLSFEIQRASSFSNAVALAVVTAGFGTLRKLTADPELMGIAAAALSEAQSKSAAAPGRRSIVKPHKALVDAIAVIPESGNVDASVLRPIFLELLKFTEGRAQAAATSDNVLLDYVAGLEEELRTYWWVVGVRSEMASKPFRDIELGEAALRTGMELAGKTSSDFGIFAAPALCDLVLATGRETSNETMTLAAAATLLDRDFRKSEFTAISEAAYGPWLPLSTAMGLAAASEDERDWQPRFKRLTGINPTAKVSPLPLAIQMYRERLAVHQFE